MRVVLIQGAFDILNSGHVRAFRLAKKQGDYFPVKFNLLLM
jgi:glycerol-3-phosphate cytidylyltransferase-like family protein